MNSKDNLRLQMIDALEASGITRSQICYEADISRFSLYRYIREGSCWIDTLCKVLDVIGCELVIRKKVE